MSGGPVRVAVLGANGRMGRAVVRLAHEGGMKVVAAIGAADVGRDAGELAGVGTLGVVIDANVDAITHASADVVVDFSAPAALSKVCSTCAKAKIALVSGTTGLAEDTRAALADAALTTAVIWEPNMSVGIHVLASLVAKAAAALSDYDVEVSETHHRMKVDAPSGTAIRLGDVVKNARALDETAYVHGREGRPGPRKPTEIGMHAMRGGDVIGDHTVFFFGDGDRIELTHRASSRDLFARGALRCAQWLAAKPAGRYTLDDVLAT